MASVSCLYTAQMYLNTVEHLWHQSAGLTQHRYTSVQWNTCGVSQLASYNTGIPRWLHTSIPQYSGTLVMSVSWLHTTQVYLNTVEHLWCQSAGLTQHRCTLMVPHNTGVPQYSGTLVASVSWPHTTQVYLNGFTQHVYLDGFTQHRCTSMA